MYNLYQIKAKSFLFWWVMASLFVWVFGAITIGLSLLGFTAIANFSSPLIHLLDFPIVALGFWLVVVAYFGGLIGWSIAVIQRRLLQNRLYWEAEGWRRNSIIGGVVGIFFSLGMVWLNSLFGSNRPYFYNFSDSIPFMSYMILPLFMLCLSAFQVRSLRHAVDHAWLWVLGNVTGAIVLTGIVNQHYPNYSTDYTSYTTNEPYFLYWVFAAAMLGFMTGLVILHLFERHIKLPMFAEARVEVKSGRSSVWDEAI